MSDDHHLVGLYDLLEEEGNGLNVVLLCRLLNGAHQLRVVCIWEHDAGKQVADDSVEQGHVVSEKFRQVDVGERPEKLEGVRLEICTSNKKKIYIDLMLEKNSV